MMTCIPCGAAEASGDVTAESLIDGYIEKNEDVQSVSGEEHLAFSFTMSMFGEEISMKIDMLMDIESTKDISHVFGDMTMTQEGMEEESGEETLQTEAYAVLGDDDTITVYSLDSGSDTWTKSVLDAGEFNFDLRNLIIGDSFELGEDTVDVDGSTCYEVKGTIALADMMGYLGSSFEGLNEIFPVEEEDAEAYKLDVFYYFDTENDELVSLKMDGASILKQLFMDALAKSFEEAGSEEDSSFDMSALLALFEIEIPEFVVEINNIEFNTVESIVIPEEALAAEEGTGGFGGFGLDEDEDFGAGDTAETISLENMTAIDTDECSIILEDINPNDTWGEYTIHAELENKTADKKLMFSIDNAYVNGVENDPYFASEVAAGKKAKASISFTSLEDYGITDFSDIELGFRVYDNDDWTADAFAEEVVHVYPHGEENAELYVREPADTDNVLVDNENISVIVTGIDEEDTWGYTLDLYIANKTDKTIMVSADDISVNGYMADPYFGHTLGAGKSAFTEMSWSYSSLEESGITEVGDIEFTLRAYDYDDWSADDLVNQVVTLDV